MKKSMFSVTLLIAMMFSLAPSFTCLAADSETLGTESPWVETVATDVKNPNSSDDNVVISYQTMVVDLNAGTEYYAKTGEPAIIEAEIGHQYSVVATASVPYVENSITAKTHFNIGNSGLTINCIFERGGGARVHTYSFKLPEGAKLAYVKDTLYSNETRMIFGSSWNNASGSNGLVTDMDETCPLNDGFILEVVSANNTTRPNLTFLVYIIIAAVIALITTFTIGFFVGAKRKR